MTSPQPSTRTKSRSLKGRETVTGGSIIMPFELLLVVLVDGWGLIVTALVGSYTGVGA